jgi:hypothetical protein
MDPRALAVTFNEHLNNAICTPASGRTASSETEHAYSGNRLKVELLDRHFPRTRLDHLSRQRLGNLN